jgi:hypothetical protein
VLIVFICGYYCSGGYELARAESETRVRERELATDFHRLPSQNHQL